MRFDPEASWGANAGLDIPRKALENVKVRDERKGREIILLTISD
jgi:hypothetical protein